MPAKANAPLGDDSGKALRASYREVPTGMAETKLRPLGDRAQNLNVVAGRIRVLDRGGKIISVNAYRQDAAGLRPRNRAALRKRRCHRGADQADDACSDRE